jgi:3-hydroxy-9,10-secoandrosta-1,3,5(10)-triene-9,17-dione monooxygenase
MSLAAAPPAEGLVERAAALVPMLLENAEATERARRLSPEQFDTLAEAGLFKMCVPRRYGGYEADFQTQCDALAEVARGCPSSSWVATILSAMAWLVGIYPDETQEEIYASGDPRVSGVFSPTGTVTRANGGFVVRGRWAFNTGGHGTQWVIVNAVLATDDGAGMPMSVILSAGDVTRLDDWYASGMAGTGSSTIVVDDVFVPAHRVLPLLEMSEGRSPGRHNADEPYFNLPIPPVLVVNAGGTPIGIARGALDAFMARLPGRGITFTDYTSQAEAPVTHLAVGEAALKLQSAEAHVNLACAILDDHPGGPLTRDQRIRARAHISHATGLAREVVDQLFAASGATAIQPHVPIQRFQRDIQALANHAIMSPSTTTELYGRHLCGLEPNTTLY